MRGDPHRHSVRAFKLVLSLKNVKNVNIVFLKLGVTH